jgi:hypothetical protein
MGEEIIIEQVYVENHARMARTVIYSGIFA